MFPWSGRVGSRTRRVSYMRRLQMDSGIIYLKSVLRGLCHCCIGGLRRTVRSKLPAWVSFSNVQSLKATSNALSGMSGLALPPLFRMSESAWQDIGDQVWKASRLRRLFVFEGDGADCFALSYLLLPSVLTVYTCIYARPSRAFPNSDPALVLESASRHSQMMLIHMMLSIKRSCIRLALSDISAALPTIPRLAAVLLPNPSSSNISCSQTPRSIAHPNQPT